MTNEEVVGDSRRGALGYRLPVDGELIGESATAASLRGWRLASHDGLPLMLSAFASARLLCCACSAQSILASQFWLLGHWLLVKWRAEDGLTRSE
ncbi:hypothetical protein Dimus_028875, partial [Dionaea muscipula]